MLKQKILFVFLLFACLIAVQVFAGSAGAVFTMDNAAAGNHVLVFERAADGSLSSAGSFATQGAGSGTGLGNQGGVVLSEDERWLLVVNAGSNEITIFRNKRDGLQFRDKISSGGQRPISLTIHDDLVYVLNAGGLVGGSDNITGFTIDTKGNLVSLPGSTRPLSATSTDPAQIEFTPNGLLLVVTEKATNIIDTYVIGADGLTSGPNSQASEGLTPFGFAFGKRRQLFVSEAFGGAANASAVTSYSLSAGGNLNVISASIGTMETAACWAVVTNDGRFTYVTNTGSGTVSGYSIENNGTIELLDSDGITATTGAGPIDMAFSNNSRFLYTLDSVSHTISAFRVEDDGSLEPLNGISGLPAAANGLAAF